MSTSTSPVPVLELAGIGVDRDGRTLLDGIDWRIRPDENWVVLGPNGSGKSTLLSVATMYMHPSRGSVTALGETLGRTDVRRLRTRIGLTSAAIAGMLRPTLTATEIVMTAKNAALEPWWHTYDEADRARARSMLDRMGCGRLADQTMATLSSGERQRVLLARTLMIDPGLLLLDEPTAGLDLGGREDLVERLADLASDRSMAPMVLVTHHVEEVPPGFSHVLLLADGRVVASGPIDSVLTAEHLGACFGRRLSLERRDGRWWAFATG